MEEIAREAGALLMDRFRRRIGFEYKGDVDLVTEADRSSEKLIMQRIGERWPGHDLFGEEGTRTNTRQRLSLVYRSAGRDDEFRARLSGVLRLHGAGA